jgi:hypothetical protein
MPRAKKTHCKQGHEYTPENSYTFKEKDGRTHRRCWTCQKERDRARYRALPPEERTRRNRIRAQAFAKKYREDPEWRELRRKASREYMRQGESSEEAKARKKEYDRLRPQRNPEAYARKLELNRESIRRKWAARTPEEDAMSKAYGKAYRAQHPDKAREWQRRNNLKRKYGMTLEEHAALLESQGGLCAACHEAPAIHTDHDHATGRVRGLLCNKCNLGLGLFADDPDRLLAAAEYLKKTGRNLRVVGAETG